MPIARSAARSGTLRSKPGSAAPNSPASLTSRSPRQKAKKPEVKDLEKSTQSKEDGDDAESSGCCCVGGSDVDDSDIVLRIHVIAAKNLAAKDEPDKDSHSKWGTSDPYCIIIAGITEQRTAFVRKCLNPEWKTVLEFKNFKPESCYRLFEVKREDGTTEWLKESALRIEVWDHDDQSGDDLIGRAVLPLPECWLDDSGPREEMKKLRYNTVTRETDPWGHQCSKAYPKQRKEVNAGYWKHTASGKGITDKREIARLDKKLRRQKKELGSLGLASFKLKSSVGKRDGDEVDGATWVNAWGGKGSPLLALELHNPLDDYSGTLLVQCLIMHQWQIEERTIQEEKRIYNSTRRKQEDNLKRALSVNSSALLGSKGAPAQQQVVDVKNKAGGTGTAVSSPGLNGMEANLTT